MSGIVGSVLGIEENRRGAKGICENMEEIMML